MQRLSRLPAKSLNALNVCGVLALVLSSVCQLGCYKSPFPVAKASGTIKSEDGALLQNGIIAFTPTATNPDGQSGKPAYAEIVNGKFVLSTYGNGDGAIVGQHNVTLTETWRPDEEFIDENTQLAPRHNCKISPASSQVEVVAGKDNVFELSAVRKTEQDINDEIDD